MRIAITPYHPVDGEAALIDRILDSGWEAVHLRHPEASLKEVKNIIEAVSPTNRSKIHLHGHFALTYEFNLGGLHLNRRCPTPPPGYVGCLSRSCHSIEEVLESMEMDYVTLSPIFDSVSKAGYVSSGFDFARLSSSPHPPAIALGGITPERWAALKRYQFDGFAVLGYLFKDLPARDVAGELQKRLDNFNV